VSLEMVADRRRVHCWRTWRWCDGGREENPNTDHRRQSGAAIIREQTPDYWRPALEQEENFVAVCDVHVSNEWNDWPLRQK